MRRGRHVSRRVARRRAAVALLAAVLGVAAWAGASFLPRWSQGAASTTPSTTATTRTTPPPTATTATSGQSGPHVPTGIGAYAYGETTLALTEPGANGGPARTLPTAIWYPRRKGAPAGGSAPDRAGGPYPLLVFSQGFWTTVHDYRTLLAYWASAGYVVVAPTYPTTDPDPTIAGTSARVNVRESDIRNHPADLRYVITAVVAKAARPGWLLSGLVDSAEIGLAGQSDGGDVSLAVGYNSDYQDPAVKAVAVLSGSEFAGFGGTYFAGSHPPLLVVQSPDDQVNVPACSVQVYDQAPSPKFYLQLQGPTEPTPTLTHLGPYTSLVPYEQVIANVTTYFFDAELAGQHGALGLMAPTGSAAVLAELSTAPTAPTPPGTCPTQP